MAVVNKYMQEEQQRVNNQRASQPYSTYNTSPVSAETRQSLQITAPAKKYTMGNNPGKYNSRYQGTLDNILNQIMNPQEFKYEFNGDEMFKNYADLYTQYGKQGMLDTMGQAVGLTGGYGNSYAQGAGQQTYQNYLLPLYDRAQEFRDFAYQGYRDELGDLKDAYDRMLGNEQYNYQQYSDAVNQWRLQQQMDAAAAARRGGGSSRGGGGEEVYLLNGKYYKMNNGKLVETTIDPNKTYNVNYSYDQAVQHQDIGKVNEAAKKANVNSSALLRAGNRRVGSTKRGD